MVDALKPLEKAQEKQSQDTRRERARLQAKEDSRRAAEAAERAKCLTQEERDVDGRNQLVAASLLEQLELD